MKSSVERLSPTRVKVSVELPADELKPSLDSALQRIAAQVNIPGFRKGKVPARVIEQRFGAGVVLEEAVNDAVPSSLAKVMVDEDLYQMSRPNVDVIKVDEKEGLEFTAEFDVRPEFDVPAFDTLKVEVEAGEASDDDVEEQLTSLRSRFGSLKDVERAAAKGDIVVVDLAGAHNGETVEDMNASALSYELGSEGMVEGFDEAVSGASAGDVRTFTFTPQMGDWAEKAIDVTVTVKNVKERELPAADDSFAQLASEFDTIEELRADMRERVGRIRLLEQAYQAREKAHDALMEATRVEVPQGAIDDEIEAHFADGHGDDEHKAEFEQNARTGVKSRMVLDKIASDNDIQATDAELSQWLIQEAQRYGMAPDQFADELVKAGQVQAAIQEVRRAKAISLVLEKIQVVDTKGNVVDLKSVIAPASDADFDAAFDAGSDEENFEADE